MKKDPLYFIAVLPPEVLQREITAIKQQIAQRWGAQHALKSPPHLTLQPPFAWPDSKLGALKESLRKLAAAQTPFQVDLKHFGAFPPRVIYISPVANEALARLFQALIRQLEHDLGFSDPRNRRPLRPHMTIAHRDLREEDFPEIWAFFKERTFERRFEVKALALLNHIQGKWVVDTTFPFAL